MSDLTHKTVISLKWKFLERITAQSVTFIVTLILARLLNPDDYGIVSIIAIFINIATVFVQGGFNTALIQNKESDSVDFSTVFYFSVFISTILYLGLYFTSPWIAKFYEKENLVILIRVLSLVLFPYAFNSVQVAYVTKRLDFKVLFQTNFLSNFISGILGIACAFWGLGPWALVIQQITCQLLICVMMYLKTDWRPTWEFSTIRLKVLFGFGSRILASNLLVTFFLNLRSLLIGKYYSSEALAYFEKGKQFPQTFMDSINGSIQTVMLPVYSVEQEEPERVKQMVRRSVQLSCYVTFPMMIGMAVVAEPTIKLLLTAKWLPCVPFLQLFAISYMCHPIQSIPGQAIKALGDSKAILRLEFVRKTIEIVLLLVTIQYGAIAVATGGTISTILSCIVALRPNKTIIKYTYKEQFADIILQLLPSILMALCVWGIGLLVDITLIKLIIQVVVGIISYLLVSALTKNTSYLYILNYLLEAIRKVTN